MVRSTLVTAWRLATSPTSTSPDLAKATTDGVVREPSAFAMTVGSPPSSTLTTELVVPRSMPTARAMSDSSSIRVDPLELEWTGLNTGTPSPNVKTKVEPYWRNLGFDLSLRYF